MHEPPIQFGRGRDGRPVAGYIVALVVLLALPWFGVECLFGWCIVQDDKWAMWAFILPLPLLLFLEFPLRLLDRIRGKEDEYD